MIIVICEAVIDPAKQKEFLGKVNESGVIPATEQEEGNISYELAASAGKEGRLYVIERWENMAALQAHMKGQLCRIRENEYGIWHSDGNQAISGGSAELNTEPFSKQFVMYPIVNSIK